MRKRGKQRRLFPRPLGRKPLHDQNAGVIAQAAFAFRLGYKALHALQNRFADGLRRALRLGSPQQVA